MMGLVQGLQKKTSQFPPGETEMTSMMSGMTKTYLDSESKSLPESDSESLKVDSPQVCYLHTETQTFSQTWTWARSRLTRRNKYYNYSAAIGTYWLLLIHSID